MKSIKNLKKEINNLCSDFITDCFIMVHFDPEREGFFNDMADNILIKRNKLMRSIYNHQYKYKKNSRKNKTELKLRNKEHNILIEKSALEIIKEIEDCYKQFRNKNE